LAAPKLLPGLLGGLFIGILSALPFVNIANCCCLWVITGGMLATYVMQQNHPYPVTVGDGALVGLFAGLVGAIVHVMVSLPLQEFLGPVMAGWSDGMMRGRRSDMPPELRRIMSEMGPQMMVIIGGIIFGAVSLVFSTLGGMLGVVFFRTPSPPAPPPVMPPPFAPPSFPSAPSSSSPSYEDSHVRPTDEHPGV
jgi:hypothetical protein